MEKIYFSPKSLLCLLSSILLTVLLNNPIQAQGIPEGINYQAIARDTSGNPISGSVNLMVKFSIFPDATGSDTLFSEIHNPVNTNIYGLFTLVIGTKDSVRFKKINWGSGDKYLHVHIATASGTFISMGRTRLMSVPYALYSKSSGNSWQLDGNTVDTAMFIGTVNNKDFIIKTDSIPRVRVSSAGNVTVLGKLGLGVLNPASTLTIIANTGNDIEFMSPAGDSADITSSTALIVGTSTATPVIFKTNESSRILIDPNGNVGIGTTSPAAKLDVAGQVKITDGTQGIGRVLTSDANGLASWVTPDTSTALPLMAGNLLPLFTTTVTNDTANHLSFNLQNAGAYSVFGNNTGVNAQPTYFAPQLASSLFQNQGTANNVLHGNASGTPTWGQITNADIATGAVNLGTNVTGILPMANGGTGANLTPANGGVVYSDASTMQVSPAGTSGQVLVSGGAGAPSWVNPTGMITLTGNSPITVNATNATNYDISVASNTATSAGVVSSGSGNNSKVWKTDGSGNPGWRVDSSGTSYVGGTGISITGSTINSVWTKSGNDIYNNNSGNVGIGTVSTVNKLDVEGNVAIGSNYSGVSVAPANGLIVEGNVGIGVISPTSKLVVKHNSPTEGVGYFENTDASNPNSTLVTTTNSAGKALFASNTGLGGVGVISSLNPLNTSTTFEINSSGTGSALWSTNIGTGTAGRFEVTGALNSSDALFVSANGSGVAGNFHIPKLTNNKDVLKATHDGLGRVASFISTNAANSSDAVHITTNGNDSKGLNVSNTGQGSIESYGVYSTATGSGTTNIAGYFNAENAADNYAGIFENGNVGIGTTIPFAKLDVYADGPDDAIYSETSGDGAAGRFYIFNPANIDHALDVYTDGTGDALFSENAGTAGTAGTFTNTASSNTSPALSVLTNGGTASAGLSVLHTGAGFIDYGMQVFNSGSGNTNVGGYFTATGGIVNNYAAIFDQGNVGIGTITPNQKLVVFGGSTLLDPNSPTMTALLIKGNQSAIDHVSSGGTHAWFSGLRSDNGGAVDNFAFMNASGTTTMALTQTGYVGIGNALPTSPLDVVYNVSNTTSGIKIRNTSNANTAFTSLLLTNDAGLSGGISLNSSTNSTSSGFSGMNIGTTGATKLQLGTNNFPRLTVDGIGNVGIGTITPASLFHVAGQIRAGFASIINGSLVFNNASNANTATVQSGVTSTSYTLTLPTAPPASNGQLLSGTTAGALSWVSASSLGAWTTTGNASTVAATNFIGTTDSIDFVERTNNQERLRITANGRVGIGINAPTSKLYVRNASSGLSGSGTAYFETTSSLNPYPTLTATSNGTKRVGEFINTNPGNASEVLYVASNGIGKAGQFEITNSANTADVLYVKTNGNGSNALNIDHVGSNAGSIDYSARITNSGGGLTNVAGYFSATNATNNYAGIFENGNVGIGTTAPVNKLDVRGGIAIGNTYGGFSLAPTNGAIIEGNVGIGTISPSELLHVVGGKILVGAAAATRIAIDPAGASISQLETVTNLNVRAGSASGNLFLGSGTTGNIHFETGVGVRRMYIGANGNVGIGTQTPGTKLEIKGAITHTPTTRAIGVGETLTPGDEGYIQLTGSAGATITGFSSTGAVPGQTVILQNVSLIPISVGTGVGVRLSSAFSMTQNDTLMLIFDGNNWIETARSVN